MKIMKKVAPGLMALTMAAAAVVPMQVSAKMPSTYNVQFVADQQVAEGVVSIGSWMTPDEMQAPAYKDVERWYCEDLDLMVNTGDNVNAYDFGEDKNVVFVAQDILADKMTVRFDVDGKIIKEVRGSVIFNGYDQIELPRIILEGELANWELDGHVYTPDDYISLSTLDEDHIQYEKDSVLTFHAVAAPAAAVEVPETEVKEDPAEINIIEKAYPDTYNIKFMAGGKQIAAQDLSIGSWMNPDEMQIPAYKEVQQWYCADLDRDFKPGDVISAYDLGTNAEIIFEARPLEVKHMTVRFVADGSIVKEVSGSVRLDGYHQIDMPRVILNGEIADWEFNGDIYTNEDYMSFSTLDNDYDFFEKNVTVTLNAVTPVQ